MPSSAKKRKAAEKKLQKQARHNDKATNFDGSHSLGSDDAKSHDVRESDGGDGERESSEEPVVNNHAEVEEEVSLGEQNIAEFAKEEKTEENYKDIQVNAEEDVRETKNGEHKGLSSSLSSSSSEDDEVVVEKEKPMVVQAGEIKLQVPISVLEASRENPMISKVVYSSVEEYIPVEDSFKQVVSLPHESNAENESAAAENSVLSHVIESEMKQILDEVVTSENVKDKVSTGVTDFVKEKTKVIQLVDEGSQNLSGVVDMTARHGEGLLPQSSGVTSADAPCGNNHVKESETHKYVEEQPLISSTPLPLRRTSWTSCCGLFEVFSGGASR